MRKFDECDFGDYQCLKYSLMKYGYEEVDFKKETYTYSDNDCRLFSRKSKTEYLIEIKARTDFSDRYDNWYIDADKVKRVNEKAVSLNGVGLVALLFPFSKDFYLFKTNEIINADCKGVELMNKQTMKSREDKDKVYKEVYYLKLKDSFFKGDISTEFPTFKQWFSTLV